MPKFQRLSTSAKPCIYRSPTHLRPAISPTRINEDPFLCVSLLGLAGSMPLGVMAHPDHGDEEPLTEQRVAAMADKSLPALVSGKKVKPEWVQARRDGIAQRTVAGKEFWIVTYKKADGLLYVFFDELGNFVEANQTGKLAAE